MSAEKLSLDLVVARKNYEEATPGTEHWTHCADVLNRLEGRGRRDGFARCMAGLEKLKETLEKRLTND